jgi:MraZ protein
MDQFVSTFTNKIDAKGRVSVPVSFRTVLAKDGFEGIYCYPSLDDSALDAGGQRLVGKIQLLLENIAPYSDERDHLAMALFGASEIMSLDQDGRIKIPERLCDHAQLSSKVVFVGLGDKFQIWEPEKFRDQFNEGRKKLSEFKRLLGSDGVKQSDAEGARER